MLWWCLGMRLRRAWMSCRHLNEKSLTLAIFVAHGIYMKFKYKWNSMMSSI